MDPAISSVILTSGRLLQARVGISHLKGLGTGQGPSCTVSASAIPMGMLTLPNESQRNKCQRKKLRTCNAVKYPSNRSRKTYAAYPRTVALKAMEAAA